MHMEAPTIPARPSVRQLEMHLYNSVTVHLQHFFYTIVKVECNRFRVTKPMNTLVMCVMFSANERKKNRKRSTAAITRPRVAFYPTTTMVGPITNLFQLIYLVLRLTTHRGKWN